MCYFSPPHPYLIQHFLRGKEKDGGMQRAAESCETEIPSDSVRDVLRQRGARSGERAYVRVII